MKIYILFKINQWNCFFEHIVLITGIENAHRNGNHNNNHQCYCLKIMHLGTSCKSYTG